MRGTLFQRLAKAVLWVAAITVTSVARAQFAAAWNYTFEETNFPKAAMDGSSNLYVVTREATQTHFYVYLTKINSLGSLVYRQLVATEPPGNQLIISGVQLGGGSVYISYYHDDASFPTGGYIARCDMATGVVTYIRNQNGFIPYVLCYKNGQMVSAGLSSPSVGFVRFVDLTDGSSIQTWSLTANYIRSVDLTSAGVAFAAGANNVGPVLAKVGINGVDWIKNPDWSTHNGESLSYVGVDEVHDRVYGLGSGYYGSGSTDLDCIVAAYDMSTGNNETKTYFGASNYDEPGALAVDPNGRLYIAWYEDVTSVHFTHAARLDKDLGLVWRKAIPASSGYGRGISFDGLNYVYVCDESPLGSENDAQVTKFHPADGTILYTIKDDVGGEDFATQVFADSAGNAYVCGMCDYPDRSFVARMQFAQFVFASTNVVGGATLNGKLRLHEDATANIPFACTSSNPSVLTIPATITVNTGTHEKAFTLASVPVAANTNVTITAKYAGNTCAKTISVLAPVVTTLSITPNSLVGGNSATGTVTLTGKAPVGGKVVDLSSSVPGVASVPATVTVAAGGTSKTFTVTTVGVSSNTSVVITSTTGTTSKTFFMAVNAPAMTSFTLTPASVQGGHTSTLTIGLDGKAPAGGWKIFTYSGAPTFVTVPASVTVPVGTWSKTATLSTVPVTSTIPVTVFGARGGVYKTATLTLTP